MSCIYVVRTAEVLLEVRAVMQDLCNNSSGCKTRHMAQNSDTIVGSSKINRLQEYLAAGMR